VTRWQEREAARIGNSRTVEAIVTDWTDPDAVAQQAFNSPSEVRAREIRRENIRRTALAS